MSCVSLFFPNSVLELTTGERGPKVIPRPTETLDQWVLGLESLPVPNQTVREFFLRHDQVLHDEEKIWTPDDPSLGTYAQVSNYTGLHSPADENEAWEAFESWLLSGQPAAPAGDREVITAWIRGLDQIPEPSVKLRNWVASMRQPQSPSKELRLMILGAWCVESFDSSAACSNLCAYGLVLDCRAIEEFAWSDGVDSAANDALPGTVPWDCDHHQRGQACAPYDGRLAPVFHYLGVVDLDCARSIHREV